jgi:D-alanyl-D-alanine dipeptidase
MISTLVPYVADRVNKVLVAMRARGYDPIVFEARRTQDRQEWLYGVGRTHDLDRKPVTWTHSSNHIRGKATDIISKSKLWSWPDFYKALKQEANKVGMSVLSAEQCHIEWRG